ncbi:MAG: hypothetical protein AAFW75_31975 [Cyanobacteria bacterium J06636_16]
MIGSWEILSSNGGSQVTVWWELVSKPKYLAPIILSLLTFQVERDVPKIIQRMTAEILGQAPEFVSRNETGAIAHLLPEIC